MTLQMLNEFEEIIVERLIERMGVQPEQARTIVNTYLPVIRLLDDQHDSAAIQAERYYRAFQNQVNPQRWVKHIQQTRVKYSTKHMQDRELKTQRTPSKPSRVASRNREAAKKLGSSLVRAKPSKSKVTVVSPHSPAAIQKLIQQASNRGSVLVVREVPGPYVTVKSSQVNAEPINAAGVVKRLKRLHLQKGRL